LRPYRPEISTCIRIQPRPRFLLRIHNEGVQEVMLDFGSAVNEIFVRDVPLAVRIGDDVIGVAEIFSIRISSSAQGAAAVSEPGLVFSRSRCPLGQLKQTQLIY
jgi:hypothetical protein